MTTFAVVPTDVPAQRLAGQGPRRPIRVRHDLSAGGVLSTERLAGLAGRLPAGSVEHNLGAVPSVLPGGQAPRAALSPGQIVRTLAANGCWMVLKNIEADPSYAALLDQCLDALEPALTPEEGPSVLREGFIFLSAPDSVTPTHIDPEHNVLLQVQGVKTMRIGRFGSDDEWARQAERLHAGEHRNLDAAALDLVDFTLQPGDGVYVPVHAPHVVVNGPEPSVSLSVTWRTRGTLREGHVHGLNHRLRARGLRLVAPGRIRAVDTAAHATERGLRLLTRASRGR